MDTEDNKKFLSFFELCSLSYNIFKADKLSLSSLLIFNAVTFNVPVFIVYSKFETLDNFIFYLFGSIAATIGFILWLSIPIFSSIITIYIVKCFFYDEKTSAGKLLSFTRGRAFSSFKLYLMLLAILAVFLGFRLIIINSVYLTESQFQLFNIIFFISILVSSICTFLIYPFIIECTIFFKSKLAVAIKQSLFLSKGYRIKIAVKLTFLILIPFIIIIMIPVSSIIVFSVIDMIIRIANLIMFFNLYYLKS